MRKLLVTAATLALGTCAAAAITARAAGLVAWTPATPMKLEAFNARDVDLMRGTFFTSLPPKQLLRFTLDNVRYRALVTRSDLTANAVRVCPAKQASTGCR